MLMSCFLFVSCDQEEEDTEADVSKDTGAKTITMRVITEKKVCNSQEELDEYLKDECGGDKESQKYLDMVETMEAYQAVEDAISKKTKSDFKTKVDILFYTENEYNQKLEEDMAIYALEKQNAEVAQRALDKYIKEYKSAVAEEYPDSAITKSFYKYFPEYEKYKDFVSNEGADSEDKYFENEFGIMEIEYPEADENQIDIVYISGYNMYAEYVSNGWIIPLNSHINTTGKKLTYNISATLLNGVKIDGETYAIPNNVQIGEYTYMLVDRDLAEQYKHTYESFDNIADCNIFVNDIVTNHKDILPIDASFKECMDLFVWYWNIDYEMTDSGNMVYDINTGNDFSLLGKFYSDPSQVNRGSIELGFNSLLADQEYRDTLLTLKKYEMDGCYKTADDSRGNPAISFVNGTYSMMRNAFYDKNGQMKNEGDADYGVYTDENGKEYFLYVAKYPKADDEAIYGNMYAISANTKSADACMEMITLLNTDPEVRNLLQYGIKMGEQDDGVQYNYHIDESTGMLVRDNDLYMMDIEKTGNCFIAYPEEGYPADYWENAKAQNNDAAIDPLAGFDFNERLAEYGSMLDTKQLDLCKRLSAELYDSINDPTLSYDELKSKLDELSLNYTGEEDVSYKFLGEENATAIRITKLTNNDYNVATGLGSPEEPEMDPDGESPYTIYYKWLVTYGYLPAEQ